MGLVPLALASWPGRAGPAEPARERNEKRWRRAWCHGLSNCPPRQPLWSNSGRLPWPAAGCCRSARGHPAHKQTARRWCLIGVLAVISLVDTMHPIRPGRGLLSLRTSCIHSRRDALSAECREYRPGVAIADSICLSPSPHELQLPYCWLPPHFGGRRNDRANRAGTARGPASSPTVRDGYLYVPHPQLASSRTRLGYAGQR